MTDAGEQEKHERERRAQFDPTKWSRDVRRISLDDVDGLGIDGANRLYWNGKRVITGQRLDLTWSQFLVALAVAIFTAIAAAATAVQAVIAYEDWACRVKPTQPGCPPVSLRVAFSNFTALTSEQN
jgi:hypothetical protein